MSAQSRWIILMVKNETVAYPRDALLRQGYGRGRPANRSMAYGLTFDDIWFFTEIFRVGDFAPEMAVDLLRCFPANCL